MTDYTPPRHSTAPQRSFAYRWCFGCRDYAPMKGGTTKPVFLCAQHKPKQDK